MVLPYVVAGRIGATILEGSWKAGSVGQAKAAAGTLGVGLTEACPVGCSHCIVGSTPVGTDVDVDLLGQWLWVARASLPVSGLCFTGGEPFYRFALLEEAVRLAHSLGLASGVITSAFWAVNDRHTVNRLERLRAAGLTSIGISVDEEHARHIPPERPRRAIRIAAGLGLAVTISARFPNWLASADVSAYLRKMVGPELDLVTDVVQGEIQPLGRAKDAAAPSGVNRRRRRLCPASMLMVAVNGTIKCCCSIELASDSPLVLGRLNELPLESAHSHWRNSVLMLALVAGGVDLLWGWCEVAGLAPPLVGRFAAHDVCGACQELLADPARVAHIRRLAAEPTMKRSLALRHFLVTGDSWALLHGDHLS